jgi:virulence-associated protein VagC
MTFIFPLPTVHIKDEGSFYLVEPHRYQWTSLEANENVSTVHPTRLCIDGEATQMESSAELFS